MRYNSQSLQHAAASHVAFERLTFFFTITGDDFGESRNVCREQSFGEILKIIYWNMIEYCLQKGITNKTPDTGPRRWTNKSRATVDVAR